LQIAGNEASISARPETHLCLDRSAGHERSAKGLALARPRALANDGNLHASGSFGEAGSAGISAASETALRTFQDYRQANCVAKGRLCYAGQERPKMTYRRSCWRPRSALQYTTRYTPYALQCVRCRICIDLPPGGGRRPIGALFAAERIHRVHGGGLSCRKIARSRSRQGDQPARCRIGKRIQRRKTKQQRGYPARKT